MAVGSQRVHDASIDQTTLDAVGRSTSFARRALRARSAFFWSSSTEPKLLIGRAGEAGDIDAEALASSFAAQVLATPGPVALGASCALGGVAVRSEHGACGVLFVADPAPRAFDAEDLALIDEVGASLARELDHETPPLGAIVSLSNALVRDASSVRTLAAQDYLAAADHLVGAAARLRELAGAEMRATPDGADRTPPAAAHEATAVAGEACGARILLADDLDLNRKLISDMLTVEGHQVDCVADGAAAVSAVQAKRYDLVLMDMIMPEMDGIAATRAIRALAPPACNVPIVALTANTFREQLDSCIEAGMDATLTKPMTFDALTDAVAAWAADRTAAA